MPKISVLMSVKNGSKDLQVSIPSVLNQTFRDFEFIICDDGSTDDTISILEEYQAKDNRIVIIRNDESKGLAFSLNRCIENAKCNILARQDADDRSDERRFEIQYRFVVEHPEFAVVGTCWYNVNMTGKISPVKVKEEPTARDQINNGLFMHPSWMMRKDLLQKVGFYTVNSYTMRSQDYHLIMKILGFGMKLYNMQEYLYYYTADENTMKRSLSWKRVKGLMWIRWDSYRRNHLPFWCYIYVLKPFITNILPKRFMMSHYKKVYDQNFS